jgi:hypothetical protein
VFVPQDPQNAAMVTLRNQIEIPHNLAAPTRKQMDKIDVLGAAVGSLRGTTDAGSTWAQKRLPILERSPYRALPAPNPICARWLTFGWLGIIARPLFLWLKWMYSHIVQELGLGDPAADPRHQPGADAVAAFADEVDAEDAARGSRRSRRSRKNTRSTVCAIREKAEDERGDFGAL